MKLFKTFAATAAVAAITMLSSCEDIVDMDPEELEEQGITFDTITLYNTWGKGASGLNAVTGTPIYGTGLSFNDGGVEGVHRVVYNEADKPFIDFKCLSTVETRAIFSETQSVLTSLNGTKYVNIDSSDYYKTDLRDLDDNFKTDTDGEDIMAFTAAKPYFIAKLGGDRGYALAKAVLDNSIYVSDTLADGTPVETAMDADKEASKTDNYNVGKVTVEYYHIPDSVINK